MHKRATTFQDLDEFVIMPNHIHGIVGINRDARNRDAINRDAINRDAINRDAINRVSTLATGGTLATGQLDSAGGVTGKHNSMDTVSLSRIIREYIQNNPANWQYDPENES